MNLYLVTCVRKSDISMPSITPVMPNQEVYVLAPDPTAAEDAAIVALHKVGGDVTYINNIRLLASTDSKYADGLLVVVSE